MTDTEKELIATIKLSLIRGIVGMDEETLLKLVKKAIEQEPKSEWQQDHAILKAHSDGANEVVDRIKKAREEVSKSCYKACITDDGVIRESKVLAIIDKLIAEVEG